MILAFRCLFQFCSYLFTFNIYSKFVCGFFRRLFRIFAIMTIYSNFLMFFVCLQFMGSFLVRPKNLMA